GMPTGQQHASANDSKRIIQIPVINSIHLFTEVTSLSAQYYRQYSTNEKTRLLSFGDSKVAKKLIIQSLTSFMSA
ncbi:MAG: hypothetical protein ABH838_02675, partial [Actinomycetota bacterium]